MFIANKILANRFFRQGGIPFICAHRNKKPCERLVLLELELLEGRVLPSTATWTGASSSGALWSDPANWQGNQAPKAGDNLVFPDVAGSVNVTSTNDFSDGTAFGSLTIGGSIYQPVDLEGNAIVLTGGIVHQLSAISGDFGVHVNLNQITLANDQTFATENADGLQAVSALVINSPINLQGFTLTLGSSHASVQVNGAISGNGGLVISGSEADLSAANTFTGPVVVQSGGLGITNDQALGSTSAGTVIMPGASLDPLWNPMTQLPHSFNLQEPLTLGGTISFEFMPFTPYLSGPINLSGPATISYGGVAPNHYVGVGGAPNLFNTNGFSLTFVGPLNPIILAPVIGTGQVISNGQTLTGYGSIDGTLVVNQGTIEPGNGISGAAFIVGSLSLGSQAGYGVFINGPQPGLQYTQIIAHGPVDLGGSTLNVSLDYPAAPTDSFTIVQSDGPLTGTFKGLPEGSILKLGAGQLQIHYVNGPRGGKVILSHPTLLATGADAGGGPEVRVLGANGAVNRDFMAYDPAFRGGVRVAVADVNGDGVPDIITAPGPGGGPDIRVFDGVTGKLIREFLPYSAQFTGGVFVAAGDVNGDGIPDIITGADAGGGPHVEVFSGADGSLLRSFYAYDPSFTGGARVAAGNVNGVEDIITAPGPGGRPDVRVFDGNTAATIRDFMAYDPNFLGGVFVAAGDLSQNGHADIVTSPGAGGGPDVRVFSGATGTLLADYMAYDPAFAGGVRVSVADVTGDGKLDVLTAGGTGGGPQVNVYEGVSPTALDAFYAYSQQFAGGVFVGAG